jgi:hypothetical protein
MEEGELDWVYCSKERNIGQELIASVPFLGHGPEN